MLFGFGGLQAAVFLYTCGEMIGISPTTAFGAYFFIFGRLLEVWRS